MLEVRSPKPLVILEFAMLICYHMESCFHQSSLVVDPPKTLFDDDDDDDDDDLFLWSG